MENVGSPLHHLIVNSGDFFLSSVLATTLTKLVIRSYTALDINIVAKNSFCTEVLQILVGLLKLGNTEVPKSQIDPDSQARICLCMKTLASPSVHEFARKAFLEDCRLSFASLLLEQRREKDAREAKKEKKVEIQADDLITLHHLVGKKQGNEGFKDVEALDLIKATGFINEPVGKLSLGHVTSEDSTFGVPYLSDEGSRLARLFQLTGWSDPVYAEAYINMQQYDIVLEVLILNRTSDTLHNVSLELSTMGDLKLCERPQNYTVGPFDSVQIKADIKVRLSRLSLS